MKNKRGWVEILEAFFAALLITAVLLLAINNSNSQQNDSSQLVYNSQIFILRTIQLNDTLRNEIINVADSTLPINSDNSSFPTDINSTIASLTPGQLACGAEICQTNDTCNFWQSINKDIYVQNILITATLQGYDPKKLKLFCWLK